MALAITRPDGTLGVNSVKGYGTYETYEYVDGNDYDYVGAGVGINQNLFNNEDMGVDVGFDFMYLNSQSSNEYDQYEGRYYTLNATVYKKGAFSPFFSVIAEYDTESGYGYDSYDSTLVGGAIGVECHLLPGWYVTPKVTLTREMKTDEGDKSDYSTFALATGYWITEHFNVFTEINYCSFDGSKGTWINTGITVHY